MDDATPVRLACKNGLKAITGDRTMLHRRSVLASAAAAAAAIATPARAAGTTLNLVLES